MAILGTTTDSIYGIIKAKLGYLERDLRSVKFESYEIDEDKLYIYFAFNLLFEEIEEDYYVQKNIRIIKRFFKSEGFDIKVAYKKGSNDSLIDKLEFSHLDYNRNPVIIRIIIDKEWLHLENSNNHKKN